jgi:ATP-binding cassette subfamily C protein
MGITRPTTGGCYLDGHATWQWDRKDFARHVGYLPQDIGLADGTVADAIARLDEPNMVLVLEAAHRSGAHEFIVGLPNGYATRLSEFGLSAGQRQRLGLARAIYGRPQLVILDEPGAWLDADGQAKLRRLIRLLRQDRTSVLFTSHEPGLLEEADHSVTLGTPGVLPRASSRNRLPAQPQEVAS